MTPNYDERWGLAVLARFWPRTEIGTTHLNVFELSAHIESWHIRAKGVILCA